ncbi:DUF6162 family protein [Oceanospirillum linum]|uniref:Uncharacterized protein n=1 Tax=Oceanospirillum linum TaxID=966 RepID=A0A1T1H9W3_OCELI|nr:hypothetical protein [Oceanospirillum linum]OOV86632.1 hypothetical protein BTA35_0212120 [Oceanospirillum linum]SEG27789.1 hypothetical protein SAMN04489856_107114 [Oleiphilus messinensis]SMP27338.1 hypothetical protein SAMN06264348_10697 [Oceanospirillum linum]
MTNSDSASDRSVTKAEAGMVQQVHPLNGQRETRWALLVLLVILLISGIGVWMNQAPVSPVVSHLSLNTDQKALLTQLSSAASEIRFIAEGETGATSGQIAWPDTETLEGFLIPPFSDEAGASLYDWSSPEGGCYLGVSVKGHSYFMLLMNDDLTSPAQIYSRSSPPSSDPCHLTDQWQHQLSEF